MGRFFLLNVNDPQDGFDSGVVAVVHMTPEYARLIMRRAELVNLAKKNYDGFIRVEFHDSSVSYFPEEGTLDADQVDVLYSEAPLILDKNPYKEEDEERTEYDRMVLDADEVWWRTSSKHSEAMAYTSGILLSEIEKYTKGN